MKKINELSEAIKDYMNNVVNGDKFNHEKDFEKAVREMLQEKGFDVPDEKHNVEHLVKMFTESVHNVDKQIPDIVVVGYDLNRKFFLEVKYCNTPQNYDADVDKVKNYITKGKCDASGVLFLDKVQREDWANCRANRKYKYYFDVFE